MKATKKVTAKQGFWIQDRAQQIAWGQNKGQKHVEAIFTFKNGKTKMVGGVKCSISKGYIKPIKPLCCLNSKARGKFLVVARKMWLNGYWCLDEKGVSAAPVTKEERNAWLADEDASIGSVSVDGIQVDSGVVAGFDTTKSEGLKQLLAYKRLVKKFYEDNNGFAGMDVFEATNAAVKFVYNPERPTLAGNGTIN